MNTAATFVGLECIACGDRFDAVETTHRCPACSGVLDPTYRYDEIDLGRDDLRRRPFDSMWRYEELLPFPPGDAVTMNEGTTPLIECPTLADEMGVRSVFIKDEGRNPTGTFKDRGHSVAVTAAACHGASDIALASAGNAGQSAAAYAARAGLSSHVFLPSRAGFTQKALVTVHGGELTVVDGRIGDASAAYRDALDEHTDWYPTQTFETPYRHEGKKTMLYEVVEQLDWEPPDAIVYPTGGGVGLIGMYKGATELVDIGLVDALPRMYAAQSTGCAPIVEAWDRGDDGHEPWSEPDTICAGIEIPDPGASSWIMDVLRDSDGGAVATSDEDILDAAVAVARREGIEMGATPAAAASGARELARRGEFDADDTVVILSTGAGIKGPDVLRGHLSGREIGRRVDG